MQIQFDSSRANFRCSSQESLGIGRTSICNSESAPTNSIPGIVILENEKLDDLPWYINLTILLGFCIIMRCIAYFSLRKNSRSSFKK
jgi:hypothetical protein